MLEIFGIIAGLLSGVSYIPYLRDIFRKTTKPERASWLIWSVLTSIALFSLFAKGATNSLWQPAVESISVIVIFLLSLKYGVGGTTRRDVFILIAAGIGLILWYYTHEAALALYITVTVDATGTIPTLIKAYQDPGSETFSTWVLVAIGGIFAMLSVGKLNLVLLSYPFYIFAANGGTALAMILGRRKKKKK